MERPCRQKSIHSKPHDSDVSRLSQRPRGCSRVSSKRVSSRERRPANSDVHWRQRDRNRRRGGPGDSGISQPATKSIPAVPVSHLQEAADGLARWYSMKRSSPGKSKPHKVVLSLIYIRSTQIERVKP